MGFHLALLLHRTRRTLYPGHLGGPTRTKTIQEAVLQVVELARFSNPANDMQTRYETELQMFRDGTELGCQVLFSGTGAEGDGGVDAGANSSNSKTKRGKRFKPVSVIPGSSGCVFWSCPIVAVYPQLESLERLDGAAKH